METTEVNAQLESDRIVASRFPTLTSYVEGRGGRYLERYENALRLIDEGIMRQSIRNVAFKEAKEALSRTVDVAWQKLIDEPNFWGGNGTSDELSQFGWDVRVHGLHEVTSAKKKCDRTKLEGPVVDTVRAFLNELQPLTDAVNSLKPFIVKGREPKAVVAPENPNKVVRTCPCCFRQIAVQGNRMVHHGYERPWDGMQTASCVGIHYKPLERSNEGLIAIINGSTARIERLHIELAEKHLKSSLYVNDSKHKLVELTPESPGWSEALKAWERRVNKEIKVTVEVVALFEDKLAKWEQTEADPSADEQHTNSVSFER